MIRNEPLEAIVSLASYKGTIMWTAAFLVFALFWAGALAQAPEKDWETTFGGGGDDGGLSIWPAEDGGYVITGYTTMDEGDKDLWMIKVDQEGTKVWDKTFGGIKDDLGWSVQTTKDGSYILVGTTGSFGSGGKDIWLIKTDEEGEETWDVVFGGTEDEWGLCLVETEDGYVILGVTSSQGSGGLDLWLIKTDREGDLVWDKTFGGTKDELAGSFERSDDGGYIIVATTVSPGPDGCGKDIWLIKTDTEGNLVWDETFDKERDEIGSALLETEDGYIILGTIESPEGRDLWLAKADLEGCLMWDKTFGGSGDDGGWAIQRSNNGGYILAGYTESQGSGNQDLWLIKADSEGEEVWDKTFGGTGFDLGKSFLDTEYGYIFVGWTESFGFGGKDLWLIKAIKG